VTGARTPDKARTIGRGRSTALSSNVEYRLGKIRDLGVLHGAWLDCGCADGGYTAALARFGAASVIGIDPEVGRIEEAKRRIGGDERLSFACAPAEALPFPSGSFDGVLLNEVLEHVADEATTLGEIHRVLRQGGHLALISPNRWFPFEGHGMKLGSRKVEAPIPLLPWLPTRLARRFMRARNYWPHELEELARGAGFEVVSTTSIFPVLEQYPWLPAPLIPRFRRAVPRLERTPGIRRLGVSTFVLARKQ
jgi:SAM-dependent methyltransferase